MLEAGDEWAAVMLFYAAYHEVKAALLDDPVFDDEATCRQYNSLLRPEDRHVARHQGRKSVSKEWGINELVLTLYGSAAGVYHRLHQMSIDVRYESGLRGSLEDVSDVWERFCKARDEGALSTGTAPDVDRQ